MDGYLGSANDSNYTDCFDRNEKDVLMGLELPKYGYLALSCIRKFDGDIFPKKDTKWKKPDPERYLLQHPHVYFVEQRRFDSSMYHPSLTRFASAKK